MWRQNLEKSRRIICWVAVTGNQWRVRNIWRCEIVHDNIIIFSDTTFKIYVF